MSNIYIGIRLKSILSIIAVISMSAVPVFFFFSFHMGLNLIYLIKVEEIPNHSTIIDQSLHAVCTNYTPKISKKKNKKKYVYI